MREGLIRGSMRSVRAYVNPTGQIQAAEMEVDVCHSPILMDAGVPIGDSLALQTWNMYL